MLNVVLIPTIQSKTFSFMDFLIKTDYCFNVKYAYSQKICKTYACILFAA